MKVILISDPNAMKSAASLDVGIGNLHSPKEIDGLATFLHHLLLHGSEKYINGDVETDCFLKKFNGNFNASSGLDSTNYTLEIDHEGLDEGVGRLVNYLISPNFKDRNIQQIVKNIHH